MQVCHAGQRRHCRLPDLRAPRGRVWSALLEVQRREGGFALRWLAELVGQRICVTPRLGTRHPLVCACVCALVAAKMLSHYVPPPALTSRQFLWENRCERTSCDGLDGMIEYAPSQCKFRAIPGCAVGCGRCVARLNTSMQRARGSNRPYASPLHVVLDPFSVGWLRVDGRECRAPFTCFGRRAWRTEGSDTGGNDCQWYAGRSDQCGNYDNGDFNAGQMCAACGGGGSCKCPASVGRNDCAVCDYTADGVICQRCTNGKVNRKHSLQPPRLNYSKQVPGVVL